MQRGIAGGRIFIMLRAGGARLRRCKAATEHLRRAYAMANRGVAGGTVVIVVRGAQLETRKSIDCGACTPGKPGLFPLQVAPVQVVEGGEGGVGGCRVQGEEPEDVVGNGQGGGEPPAGGADRDGLHRRSLRFGGRCMREDNRAEGSSCNSANVCTEGMSLLYIVIC